MCQQFGLQLLLLYTKTAFASAVLENIQLKRERLDMGAIYFIEPSETSVKRLLEDFKDKDKPQYKEVHLYFTTRMCALPGSESCICDFLNFRYICDTCRLFLPCSWFRNPT